jgi:two-component system, NarL family, nitrate/nitrite response regulator NarL
MRVLVVEDDGFTRLAISSALRSAELEVRSTGSASEALEIVGDWKPNSALLDLHLGSGPNGIDLAIALRRQIPRIGLVFLTSFTSPRLLSTNSKLPKGAKYLTKSSVQNSELIIQNLRDSLLPSNETAHFDSKLSKLTDLQIETLRLVAAGLSNSEIAKKRFVTEATVEKTIARASKALGLGPSPDQNQRVRIARFFLQETGQSVSLEQ